MTAAIIILMFEIVKLQTQLDSLRLSLAHAIQPLASKSEVQANLSLLHGEFLDLQRNVLQEERAAVHTCQVSERGLGPLAVISTTMPYTEQKLKQEIQRNFVRGLMAQNPVDSIYPLVFTDSDKLAEQVQLETQKMHGGGLPIDTAVRISEALHGYPTVRSIMRSTEAAARKVGAAFYGYANGDILFTEDLVSSLRLVSEASHSQFFASSTSRRGVMIIGRRTNVNFTKHAGMVNHEKPCVLSERLLVMAKDGIPMGVNAIDYFIFSTDSRIDWASLEDWIVGNVAYDQYLIKYALDAKLNIIDATDTIHAFHQTGSDGNAAGRTRSHDIKVHNQELWFGSEADKACVVRMSFVMAGMLYQPSKVNELWTMKRLACCFCPFVQCCSFQHCDVRAAQVVSSPIRTSTCQQVSSSTFVANTYCVEQVTSCAHYRSTWMQSVEGQAYLGIQAVKGTRGDDIPAPLDLESSDVHVFRSGCVSAAFTPVATQQDPSSNMNRAYDLSFLLYLVQTCHLIARGGWVRANIRGSGQIVNYAGQDMWQAADCPRVFPKFDVSSLRRECVPMSATNAPAVPDCAYLCVGIIDPH